VPLGDGEGELFVRPPQLGDRDRHLGKADYEGGLRDLVLGYGVGPADVPPVELAGAPVPHVTLPR